MRTRDMFSALVLSLATPICAALAQPLRSTIPAPRIVLTERRTQAIYTSPLSLVLLGAYSLEYERVIAPAFTVGVGATYENTHSVTFTADAGYDLDASAKLRYYPDEEALEGFSIALVAGGTRYQRPNGANDIFSDSSHTNSAATIGVSLDKNSLLGRQRRLLFGYGIGAKRRFVQHPNEADKFAPNRLTLRLVLGYAF